MVDGTGIDVRVDNETIEKGADSSPYKNMFGNAHVLGQGRPKGERPLENLNSLFADESIEFRNKARQRAIRVLMTLYRSELDVLAVQEACYLRRVGLDKVKKGEA